MQTLTIGNKKGLVFPIMCNGCVKIDYSDNIPDIEGDSLTTTDQPYGIWGHQGSFTFDALITPYETNGSGLDVTTSKKTMPNAGHFSVKSYVGAGHEMTIFHSTKLKIFLVNDSYTTGSNYTDTLNYNNPATYKIKVELTTGSTTTTLTSDTIINPSVTQPITLSDSLGIFNTDGRLTHKSIESLGSSAHGGGNTFTSGFSPASSVYNLGELLFTRNGFNSVNIGRITNLSGTTVTLSKTPSSLNSQRIYREALKEATYVNDVCHIGVTYNNVRRTLSILYNGRIIKSVDRTETTDFQLDAEDLFLGANGANIFPRQSGIPTNMAVSNKQFYGVFHEMSYSKGTISSFDSGVLKPTAENNLMFLTFEEVDL